MTAKFDLQYDSKDAVAGFKALADAVKLAEAAGAKFAPEVLEMVNRIQAAGDEAREAAADTSAFDKQVDELSQSIAAADASIGSFTVSTSQFGNTARKTASEIDRIGGSAKRGKFDIDQAADAFGGLEKLLGVTGAGAVSAYAGEVERLFKGFKEFSNSGSIGSIVVGLGSIAAIAGSLYVLWKDYNEVVEQTADKNSLLDGTLLSLAHSMGLISDETRDAVDILKQGDEFVKKFADSMKAADQASIQASKSISDAIAAIEQNLESTRNAFALTEELVRATDPAELGERINQMLADLKQLQADHKATAEDVQKYAQAINALEQRRIELIQEQKRAREEEAKAEESSWERTKKNQDERLKRHEELHKRKMDAIKAEEEAQKKADDEAKKRDEEKKKSIDDRLKKLKEINQAQAQPAQPQPAQPSQGGASPQPGGNPYGEGQAIGGPSFGDSLMAGLALPSFGNAPDLSGVNLPNFGGYNPNVNTGLGGGSGQAGPGQQGGGAIGGEAAAEVPAPGDLAQQVLDAAKENINDKDLIDKVVQDRLKEISDARDAAVKAIQDKADAGGIDQKDADKQIKAVERDADRKEKVERRNVARQVKGKDTGEDAGVQADRSADIADAQKDLVDQQLDRMKEQGKASQDTIDLLKQQGQLNQQEAQEAANMQKDIAALKAALDAVLNGRKGGGGGAGAGRGAALRRGRG